MTTVFQTDENTGDFEQQRRFLLDEIADDAARTAIYTGRSFFSGKVMAALAKVDRHHFVPADLAGYAYENHPLPIGNGQTISQPYIVALMTDLLDLNETDCVLEIGTGSGYQAAVLAELARQVYSVELVEPLGTRARAKLESIGYRNVSVKIGDGWQGWAEHAPYDAIIVTAAPEKIPDALVQQLKTGGKLIIPIGPVYGAQELVLVEKLADGSIVSRSVLPVSFVPLISGE
jgi:protein-L-isoaspartate(D-aspartate) O-methyltransferase